MTYKQRYMLENEKAIKQANRRAKMANTVACALILLNILLIIIGISAIDYNPVTGAVTMGVSALAILIIVGICKLLGLEMVEERLKDDVISVCEIRMWAKLPCQGCVYDKRCKKYKITREEIKKYTKNFTN